MRDQDGNPLQVVELPMPGLIEYDGPAIACKLREFLYCEWCGSVADVFAIRKTDAIAIETLQKLFADRRVVGIDSTNLILGSWILPLPDAATTCKSSDRVRNYGVNPSFDGRNHVVRLATDALQNKYLLRSRRERVALRIRQTGA